MNSSADTISRSPPTGSHADEALLLRRILQAADQEALLDLLLEQLSGCGELAGYLVTMVDPERRNLRFERLSLAGSYQSLSESYRRQAFPVDGDDLSAVVFRSGHRLLLDSESLDQYPPAIRSRVELLQASSVAVLPIIAAGDVIGTVGLYRQRGRIDADIVCCVEALLNSFAPQLARMHERVALERRATELHQAERNQRAFLSFISAINRLTDTESIYRAIGAEFLRRFDLDLCGIAVREGEELVVQHLARAEGALPGTSPEALEAFYQARRFPLDSSGGGLGMAFERDSSIFFGKVSALRDAPMVESDRQAMSLMGWPETLLIVPLRRQGEPLGVVWLVAERERPDLDTRQQALIEQLTDFVGTAVGNAQVYDLVAMQNKAIDELNRSLRDRVGALQAEVNVDRLTGLFNFGYFEDQLQRRAQGHERRSGANETLSLALFDIDHFKRFNDTYGHPAGNVVLQEVARRIRAVAREQDIPCRYGGEEFVVLLPACDEEGARRFAERARREVSGTPFFVDGEYLPLTISGGCATRRGDEAVMEFLKRADAALYRAKQAGRNRVEVSD